VQEGWRRATAGIGAVAIVAAVALLTITVLGALDGDDDRQTVGLGPTDPSTTTTTDRPTTTRRSTTTTSGDPEVLGETTEREPDGATTGTNGTTGPAPTTVDAAPRPGPAAAPTATVAPPPPASPTTTTCRGSTDPACGPLVWDPDPGAYEVEVDVVEAPPTQAVVGESVTVTLDYVERAGSAATGACEGWTVRGPGISDATTCEAVAHSCARYGTHEPPPPSTDRVRVTRTITFDAPGTYRIQAEGFTATHLPDGCANPYLESWAVPAVTVTVVEA